MNSFTRLVLVLAACFAWPAFCHAQYGIYLELHRRDVFPPPHVDDPLLDGVVVGWPWADLEPEKGKFNLALVDKTIDPWIKAGKKIIIAIAPAGQGQVATTPGWVLRSIPKIDFDRTHKDFSVSVPKYWDPKFLPAIKPLVHAMGERYGTDPHIEAVMVGVAHLGFLTAAPNEGGARAFIEAGWTPQVWKEYTYSMIELYRAEFPAKPLIIRGSPVVVHAPNPESIGFPQSKPQFIDLRDEILYTAATKYGVSVACNGLKADPAKMIKSGFPDLYTRLNPGAAAGRYRLELSDDWPIWVNAKRRETSQIDRGKDNAYFAAALENALGGVRGLPRMNVGWIKLFESELNACDPRNPDYQPECSAKLRWFRSQLVPPVNSSGD